MFSAATPFSWTVSSPVAVRVYFASSPNPDLVIGSSASATGNGSLTVSAIEWNEITNELGPSSVYYWTVGAANGAGNVLYAGWRTILDSRAKLLSPSNRTTLPSGSTTFTWDAGSGAEGYRLWVGSEPGAQDLFSEAQGSGFSRTLTLPSDGRPVYVRLWTMFNGTWSQFFDYSFVTTLADAPTQKAQMVYPVQGSVLPARSVTFSWDRGRGARGYSLWVGSLPGKSDLFSGELGTNVSRTLSLPTDGRPIYVRLWTTFDGRRTEFNAYSYIAHLIAPEPARIISPSSGSQLTAPTTTFTWDEGKNAEAYALWVGSTPGGWDLLRSPRNMNRSATAPIPTDGRPIYVRLWTRMDGLWEHYQDSTYVAPTGPAANVKAQLTSPPNASTLPSTTVTLAWNRGTGAQGYRLWVGSSPDTPDLLAKDVGLNLSETVNVPGDGRTIYVRLWTMFNGTWQQFNTYTFTCPSLPPSEATITSPADRSVLPPGTATFTWSADSRAQSYSLWVGSSPGANDIHSGESRLATSATVNLPTDGRPIYATLRTLVAGQWQANGLRIYETTATPSSAKAQLQTPANDSTLTSANLALTWSPGASATRYALWVGSTPGSSDIYGSDEDLRTSQTVAVPTDGRRIYVRLWTLLAGVWIFNDYTFVTTINNSLARIVQPDPDSTLTAANTTFQWTSGNGTYSLWIGSQPGAYDIYSGNEGSSLSRTVTLPTDGRPLFAQLWTTNDGTFSNSYAFTAPITAGLGTAALVSPAPGSTLAVGTTTFNWTPGAGAQAYRLWIGSTPDANDLYSGTEGTNLSKTLQLPEDGRPVYVRLWTSFDGQWTSYRSYTFTTSINPRTTKARLISPANGSRLSGGPFTLEWSEGRDVVRYTLHVGTKVGARDLYSGTEGLRTSKTLTLPADLRTPIYVRLWTQTRSARQFNDYIFYPPVP